MLTAGEVKNAREFELTDLFVVDGITYYRLPDGTVEAEGGVARRYVAWTPRDTALKITRYRYTLPGRAEELGELD